jgi:hypothetical protein
MAHMLILSAAQTSKVVVTGYRLHAAWSLEPEALALYAMVNNMANPYPNGNERGSPTGDQRSFPFEDMPY